MIPQCSPLENYLSHKADIDAAINRVLTGGRYILADETFAFEREFADYMGIKYSVSVGSGTDALSLALRACGIGHGDEVITVSHTAVATIAAIEMCGAHPVLLDIDPDSYTVDLKHIDKVISEQTKAIIPVHIYGQPSDLIPLIQYAKSHKLIVIEDCAQSHGAMYHGQKTGSWGDAGASSFYPTKNLGCLGDGGAITTNSLEIYEKLLGLRQYGWDKKRISKVPGYNSRLDELQAAILRVKLRHLDADNRKRFKISSTYSQALKSAPLALPATIPQTTHVYHQYVIRCLKRAVRDGLMSFMVQRGIQSAIHYPDPVHLQTAYVNRLGNFNSLPITERVADTILSLPMYPELTDENIDKISATIREYFDQTG